MTVVIKLENSALPPDAPIRFYITSEYSGSWSLFVDGSNTVYDNKTFPAGNSISWIGAPDPANAVLGTIGKHVLNFYISYTDEFGVGRVETFRVVVFLLGTTTSTRYAKIVDENNNPLSVYYVLFDLDSGTFWYSDVANDTIYWRDHAGIGRWYIELWKKVSDTEMYFYVMQFDNINGVIQIKLNKVSYAVLEIGFPVTNATAQALLKPIGYLDSLLYNWLNAHISDVFIPYPTIIAVLMQMLQKNRIPYSYVTYDSTNNMIVIGVKVTPDMIAISPAVVGIIIVVLLLIGLFVALPQITLIVKYISDAVITAYKSQSAQKLSQDSKEIINKILSDTSLTPQQKQQLIESVLGAYNNLQAQVQPPPSQPPSTTNYVPYIIGGLIGLGAGYLLTRGREGVTVVK